MSILYAFLHTTMNRNGITTTRIITLKPIRVHVWNKGPKNAKKVSFQGPKNAKNWRFYAPENAKKYERFYILKKDVTCTANFWKKNLSSTQSEREFKWHTELQATFGTDFWGKTYSLTAGIQNENKIKWLQYQIVRNSLFTNYKVNKIKPHISPFCTFCGHLGNILFFLT